MSQVTSVIITTAPGEDQIEAFNTAWDFDGCPKFENVSLRSAGSKYPQCKVYVGGFNYLDLQGFIFALKKIDWLFPNSLQLFVMEEHESRFREVKL